MLGNERRRVLPIWELEFGTLAPGSHAIATEQVKHNIEYQERHGVLQGPAQNLPPALETRIKEMVKRICRILKIDGYVRLDFRLSTEGVPYFIDANPNPEIAQAEEFAQSALHDGLKYPDLLNRIIGLGISRARPADAET
jgi:D-alanine-D-alanine ligase